MPNAPIADREALEALLERLRGCEWIALDTEFVRVKTYYARLCLVQIAAPGGEVACVDPLAVEITPLLDFLYAPRPLKVIHAARQDLEVLSPWRGGAPPGPVFDTQIAAALCGYDEQMSYAQLVEALTGVKLDKLHTRAHWDRRPLGTEELRYAEEDVRYLCEVYATLSQRLATLGRSAWLEEDCAALLDPALYRQDPERAFQRLKQGARLSPAVQPVLAALAAWRERTAQAHDLPRHWVVPDEVLVAIAQHAPTSRAALLRVPGAGGAVARKWAEAILAAVAAGRAQGPQRLWPEPQPLDRREQELLERLSAHLRGRAQSLGLRPAVLAARRELLALLRGADSALLHGWRRQVVGDELLALLHGRAASRPVAGGQP